MKVLHHNFNKLIDLGYSPKPVTYPNFEVLEVNVKDFIGNSKKKVLCKCDSCSSEYTTKLSGNLNICTKCQRTKAGHLSIINLNNYKKKQESLSIINQNEKEIIDSINLNNTKIATINKKYGLSGNTLSCWLKERGITPEHSLFTIKENRVKLKNSLLEKIPNYSEFTIGELAEKMNISSKEIQSLIRNKDISKLPTTKEKQKQIKDKIKLNIKNIINRNINGETLGDIAKDYNVAPCTLSTICSSYNIDVVLHPPKNTSKGEREVTAFIESLGENVTKKRIKYSKNSRQYYELDIFVESLMIGIEYCGEYWHRNEKTKHRDKMLFFKNMGITLITIFESEWKQKRNIIESMIRSRLGKCKRIYARDLMIRELSNIEARKFHNDNHLSGYVPSKLNFGLYDENDVNKIYCTLSLSKSRFNKNIQWEITRFCSLLNHSIVGGLSRLLSFFKMIYKPESILTYADLRFGEGNSYKLVGFTLDGITPPNYWYIKNRNGSILESRMRYQKHKLKHFKSYDPTKSELQIMEEEHYFRIYDCGNHRFIWKNG